MRTTSTVTRAATLGAVAAGRGTGRAATDPAGPTGHRSQPTPYGPALLAACQGRESEASRLIEASTEGVVARGEGMGLAAIQWASALLYNGLGRYEEALAAAELASGHPHDPTRVLPELIEAATRCGMTERAVEALEGLSDTTRASGTDWGLGIEARSRALLSDSEAAERLYREAIERFARTRARVELARAHLLYGEWLRRERRRLDARKQLRIAHELFTGFGMEAFAERARVELGATGEHARKRAAHTRDDLTAQEAQISRLAAEGARNREIAAQLFISPSTVDYHLRKAFRKLGVKSRHQLTQRLLPVGVPGDADEVSRASDVWGNTRVRRVTRWRDCPPGLSSWTVHLPDASTASSDDTWRHALCQP